MRRSCWTMSEQDCTGRHRDRAPAGSARSAITLAVAHRAVLMMTARFGRSPVRQAAYRLRAWRRDLDLTLSGACSPISSIGAPLAGRARQVCAGRADLVSSWRPCCRTRRWPMPLRSLPTRQAHTLGSGGERPGTLRHLAASGWDWNGWPEEWFPYPTATYARLALALDATEFEPRFDPILFTSAPDFIVSRDAPLLARPTT